MYSRVIPRGDVGSDIPSGAGRAEAEKVERKTTVYSWSLASSSLVPDQINHARVYTNRTIQTKRDWYLAYEILQGSSTWGYIQEKTSQSCDVQFY